MVSNNLRILVAEDDSTFATQLGETLRNDPTVSATVTISSQVDEAIERLRTGSFDAVLLDLNLPDGHGLEAFARIRAVAPNSPLIVLTSVDGEATAVAALAEGAEGCLVKDAAHLKFLSSTIRHAVARCVHRVATRTTGARYRSLLEGSVQGIVIHCDGIIRFGNRALANLLGFNDPEEMIGQPIWPLIVAEDRPGVESYARVWSAGRPPTDRYELRVVRRDGSVRWVEVVRSAIVWEGKIAVMAALVDETDHKLAAERLRASEERFRLLADNIKEGFFILEASSGQALYLSHMLAEFWGRPADQGYADPASWLQAIEPEDRAAFAANFDSWPRGDKIVRVFRVHRPDGSVRWLRARIFPVNDDRQQASRFVGLVEDITEVRETEERLRQAQKMEAVGQLAGGIAHDFNNLIQTIQGNAELWLLRMQEESGRVDEVREILTATEKCRELTRNLLTFSRQMPATRQLIDLNEQVRQVHRLLSRTIPKMVMIELQLAGGLPPTHADPSQIQQVIMNLMLNAKDAMPDGGSLRIETATVELDEQYCGSHHGLVPGPYISLSATDTGIGMSAETVAHVFEPFFTTKVLGKGTGLGLSTVYGIVKAHAGAIECASQPGRGTSFQVFLPAAAAPEDAADAAPTPECAAEGGGETILVVDDDSQLLAFCREALVRAGFAVISASDGETALSEFASHRGSISAVVLDLLMPGMGGLRCLENLRRLDPSVRVVVTSGCVPDADSAGPLTRLADTVLIKPYKIWELCDALRRVLGPGPPGKGRQTANEGEAAELAS
jgi:hypothetical protein